MSSNNDTFQTVRGAVCYNDSGYILPHEHTVVFPLDLPEESIAPIRDYFVPVYKRLVDEFDCRTIVEVTPRLICEPEGKHVLPESYRRNNTVLYKEICDATGMNLVLCTGFYLKHTRPAYFFEKSVNALADEMIRDVEIGIDDTGVRAGIIKVAIGDFGPDDRKLLSAAAVAQKETGAAITTHTCSREHRFSTLDYLEGAGVDPGRIYLGHADANAEVAEMLSLAQRGCNLLLTIWGISNAKTIGWNRGPLPKHHSAYICRALADEGYLDNVLVSVDADTEYLDHELFIRLYEVPERNSCFGFTFIKPELENIGLSPAQVDHIMIKNPRKMLAMQK